MASRIYAAGGWYTGDTLNVTQATKKLLMIQFGGAPGGDDWYRTLDAIIDGRLDPRPSIGAVVGLDDVPDAIALARKAHGPRASSSTQVSEDARSYRCSMTLPAAGTVSRPDPFNPWGSCR